MSSSNSPEFLVKLQVPNIGAVGVRIIAVNETSAASAAQRQYPGATVTSIQRVG